MKILEDIKLDFNDVTLEPAASSIISRNEVDLTVSYRTSVSGLLIKGTPIISANMSSVSTFAMATELARMGLFCALHKHYTAEELIEFFKKSTKEVRDHTFYTLGMHDLDKFQKFVDEYDTPKLIMLDVAHGGMYAFAAFVNKVRSIVKNSAIIAAGNVVTPDTCKRLIDSGADIIKIGVGSSAVCRTRTVAGCGIPQFSAIVGCQPVIDDLGGLSISDGGCNTSGDFAKAFGAGANFVMAGTMFAGHDECGGSIINGNKMEFYGMSSEAAMNKHNGGMASYRSAEGIHTLVDYKGPVSSTVNQILGGLRSSGSYINAKTLAEFYDKAVFAKVNRTHNKLFGE